MLAKTDLFVAGQGFARYRIPGITVTARGTVLAYCEARSSGGDWDAHAVVLRRSTDGGSTWGPQLLLVPERVETVNNPVMIAAKDGKVHFLWQTDYNRLYHQVSLDDGLTFSPPQRLAVLESYREEYDWTCAAIGPGHGIETREGMLVIPIWLAKGEGRNHYPSVVSSIRSLDGGRTWERGAIVYDRGKEFLMPNETTVAQCGDGSLLYSIRHRGANNVRFQMRSQDGLTFTDPVPAHVLADPRCFGSLAGREDKLYYAGCITGGRERKWLMIRRSLDRGETWPGYCLVEAGEAGYADLAVSGRELLCLYERGNVGGDQDVPAALTLATLPACQLENHEANRQALALAVQAEAAKIFDRAGIVLTDEEKLRIEVADMGLDRLTQVGLELITYINTDRCCAKELVLLPGQTCPQHIHPTIDGVPGKEETFRCRAGVVYLYVSGEATQNPACLAPSGDEPYYTAAHQVVLHPGEQYTIHPDTPHWFVGGPQGAIVSEFSTHSNDDTDIFLHPDIARTPLLN